jgi:hypothetical protein
MVMAPYLFPCSMGSSSRAFRAERFLSDRVRAGADAGQLLEEQRFFLGRESLQQALIESRCCIC